MKSRQEQKVEANRLKAVEEAIEFLYGKELNDRLIEINSQVAKWKAEFTELVLDAAPF